MFEDLQFKHRNPWKAHETKHTGEKAFECQKCGRKFLTKAYLKQHDFKVHKNHQSLFECYFCDFTHKFQINLRNHEKLHTESKSWKCNLCCASFKTREYLQRHASVHATIRAFTCQQCGKSYKSVYELKKQGKTLLNLFRTGKILIHKRREM